jgi:hypothetical protein
MSESVKNISTRIINKHDLEVNWQANSGFVPFRGELIVYDSELDAEGNLLALPEGRTVPYSHERLKIGDGSKSVGELPFIDDTLRLSTAQIFHDAGVLSNILENYLLNIDYDTMLAFDTSEIVTGSIPSTTAVLGQAILGQMVLA